MSATEIKRPNFYEGQYLGAADLIAAQEYQRQQDQRHRLAAHTWGIAAGLELDERAQQGSSSAVDVFIKPGYAVDGFGRSIVVLEPFKIPEALFAQFTLGAGPLDGRWIPVWLRHHEEKTNPPGPGFVICDVEDQAYRVLETFRIVVGELSSTSQQRDQIALAGRTIDAASELPDASVPYQALPESGDADRWLIQVGSVRWLAPNPPATTAGHFVKSVSDDDKKRAREGRPYVGVVAETIMAPAGKLRIRDRASPNPQVPETPELLGIEGSLRVDGISHFRDLLITDSYVNVDSQNLNVGDPPAGGPPLGGPALTFGLLSLEGIASKRTPGGNQYGLDFYTKNVANLSITNGGNVGIATQTPVAKLEVVADWSGEEGALRISGDKPTVRFTGGPPANNESWIAHLGSNGPGNLEFFRRSGPAAWDRILSLTPSGHVGIGTSAPTRTLEVVGDIQVSGSIFVGNTMIPIHTPVDVVTGERRFTAATLVGVAHGFRSGIDTVGVTSRLRNVSRATMMVALSDVSNVSVATDARWSVQAGNVTLFNNPDASGALFEVNWRVDDDGEIVCYQYVVVFEP